MTAHAMHAPSMDNIMALARDKSSGGRRELLTQISDLLFEEGGQASDRERALMIDIMRNLVFEVEMKVRKELANRLLEAKQAPRELAAMLANDEIEVARPILLGSSLLRDEELLEIIKHRTMEHQLAIAARQEVSEVVSGALVEAGNESVITTLLENPSAKVSETTLEYLVEQSQRVDSFQNPLLKRGDLSQALAERMYIWVSDTLRENIIGKYSIDPVVLEEKLKTSTLWVFEQEKRDASKAEELVEALVKNNELSPGVMTKALRDGEVPLFLCMLGRIADLQLETVRRIVFDSEGEVFAVSCKAIGLEKHQFSDLYKMVRNARPNQRDSKVTEMTHLLTYFDQLKRQAAQSVLENWRKNPQSLVDLNQKLQKRLGHAPAAPATPPAKPL
ncbi:MAG: DUF2336 domain-containing protein [Dongiaceae bacterium]